MTILEIDKITPVAKKAASGPGLRWWCGKFGVAFALTFAPAIAVAPTVIAEVAVTNEYNDYLQETHLVNATITSVTPDNKSETLTPAEGEGSTLITRPHDTYDTIGKTASVRVLSDGRFIEPLGTSWWERIVVGLLSALMTFIVIMMILLFAYPS